MYEYIQYKSNSAFISSSQSLYKFNCYLRLYLVISWFIYLISNKSKQILHICIIFSLNGQNSISCT